MGEWACRLVLRLVDCADLADGVREAFVAHRLGIRCALVGDAAVELLTGDNANGVTILDNKGRLVLTAIIWQDLK